MSLAALIEVSTLPALALVAGLAIGGVWLAFFLYEDREKPEPLVLVAKTFGIGALLAWVAAAFQYLAITGLGVVGATATSIAGITLAAAIEEGVKFLAVFTSLRHAKDLDEPIDYMIYMVVVALGFATMENLLFLFATESVTELVGLALLRFLGATLMHAIAAGFIGYFWARRELLRGLIIAVALHASFNYLILKEGPVAYPILFIAILAIPVFSYFDKLHNIHDYAKQE